MENKFYQLTEDQKKRLNQISAKSAANNEGYRQAAQTFSELQTQVLIEKDAFYKEIAKLMQINYTEMSRAGFGIKIEEGVAKLVDLNPKKEGAANV